MAYEPSLNDLPTSGYEPSLNDIPSNISNVPANQDIISQLSQQEQSGQKPESQYMQPLRDIGRAGLGAAMLVQPESALLKFPGFLGGIANALGRIGAGTGYMTGSEMMSPDNNQSLADTTKHNLALNSLLESVPIAGKGIGKVASAIMPESFVPKLMNYLSPGSKTLEDNGKSLAADIKSSYDQRVKQASDKYNPILKEHGEKEIYPVIHEDDDQSYRYIPEINPEFNNSYLKKNINEFKKNPTIKNAHDLQSEIGDMMGKLQRMQPSPEIMNSFESLKETRDNLKNGILNTLSHYPGAAEKYQLGTDIYREHVVPYRADPQLKEIALGNEKNPKNPHNIFEYPTDISKTNQEYMGPINKVLSDLPEESKNKILFSKLGGSSNRLKAESLINKLEDAKNKGYSTYFTPQLENQIASLSSKINGRNIAQKAADFLAGSALGHSMGIPGGEEYGALATGILLPSISKGVSKLIPSGTNPFAQNIGKGIGAAYRPVGRALMTNNLNNQ